MEAYLGRKYKTFYWEASASRTNVFNMSLCKSCRYVWISMHRRNTVKHRDSIQGSYPWHYL